MIYDFIKAFNSRQYSCLPKTIHTCSSVVKSWTRRLSDLWSLNNFDLSDRLQEESVTGVQSRPCAHCAHSQLHGLACSFLNRCRSLWNTAFVQYIRFQSHNFLSSFLCAVTSDICIGTSWLFTFCNWKVIETGFRKLDHPGWNDSNLSTVGSNF